MTHPVVPFNLRAPTSVELLYYEHRVGTYNDLVFGKVIRGMMESGRQGKPFCVIVSMVTGVLLPMEDMPRFPVGLVEDGEVNAFRARVSPEDSPVNVVCDEHAAQYLVIGFKGLETDDQKITVPRQKNKGCLSTP
jgi:hypothetical protein